MTVRFPKGNFFKPHSSKVSQLQRFCLVLCGLTASVSMSALHVSIAIATTNNITPAKNNELLAQASTTNSNVEQATVQLQDYYQAINARNYEQAYADWYNQGQASGQSLAEFSRGYANTNSVTVEVAEAGRVEGAAGSSYATLPVTITAIATSRKTQRFGGTYVLRKVNDEMRTPVADRGWRIYSADITQLSNSSPTPPVSSSGASNMLSRYDGANIPLLQTGSRGQVVKDVQAELKVLKLYSSSLDGNFGPMTRQAVMQFQRQHRLAVDGVVGPATWAALIAA